MTRVKADVMISRHTGSDGRLTLVYLTARVEGAISAMYELALTTSHA